jgi:hypothetical protein
MLHSDPTADDGLLALRNAAGRLKEAGPFRLTCIHRNAVRDVQGAHYWALRRYDNDARLPQACSEACVYVPPAYRDA